MGYVAAKIDLPILSTIWSYLGLLELQEINLTHFHTDDPIKYFKMY